MLVLLLVLQQLGWMIYSQKLVNKAMSRTYYEFKQSESLPSPKPQGYGTMIPVQLPLDEQPSGAELLNSLLPKGQSPW